MSGPAESSWDDTAHGEHAIAKSPFKVVDVEQPNSRVDPNDYIDVQQVHLPPTGKWYHAAGHLCTTIATPAAYAPLPFALAQLGWPAGVTMLAAAGLVTWYTSLLLASLYRWDGKKHLRYCDLAESIYGRGGKIAVIVFQQIASIGNNLTIQIIAGISMKSIYRQLHDCDPDVHKCGISLQAWIAIFGAVQLFISQLPDISHLKEMNIFCTACTVGFAVLCLILSVKNGNDLDRSTVTYSITGTSASIGFSAMFALGTIAFAFGDTILPEIQATMAEPAKPAMYKGISTGYSILLASYLTVAIAGYWAFGFDVTAYVVDSFSTPGWAIILTNLFAVLQITGCYQIYCRPTFDFFYRRILDHKQPTWSTTNVIRRFIVTSIYLALVTLVCCALPFFGDFVAFVGAIGFTPMDFILPIILWLKVGKHSSAVHIANWFIIIFYSTVSVLGAVGSVRFIIQDAVNFNLFADLF
eukprot:jgi/Botrbrau1/9953/Bobra.0012s0048.1